MATISCITSLLYSVMSLSNATKSEVDSFSSYFNSYSTKITHSSSMVFVALYQNALDRTILLAIAIPFVIDAIFGLYVLRKVFKHSQVGNREAFQNTASEAKAMNNRTPKMLRKNEMFQKSWKFDLFNKNQITKQMLGILVIFTQIYFSALGLIEKKEHFSLSMVVFVYSVITLFTFFNVAHVRDLEAVTVNFTTYVLAVASILSS